MNYDPQERRIREALAGVLDVTEYEVECVKGQTDYVTVSGFYVEGERGLPAPDPETVATIEALEASRPATDELLRGAMEAVCRLISRSVSGAEECGANPEQLIEINRSVEMLARQAAYMHGRLDSARLKERLQLMRDVERRNRERVKEWSEGL